MTQVRTYTRFTSVAVIMALMAVTVVAVCCVATGTSMGTGTTGGLSACAAGIHAPTVLASRSAYSPEITKVLSTAPHLGIQFVSLSVQSETLDSLFTEVPLPVDPRHGRISV